MCLCSPPPATPATPSEPHSCLAHGIPAARRSGIGNLCLGPEYNAEQIKQVLENCKLRFRYLLTADELVETAVAELDEHRIVAWMQGRMEFGPRALATAVSWRRAGPVFHGKLNAYIKHREGFRKFAASVPAELAGDYFDVGPNARFLATVGRVKPQYRKQFGVPFSPMTWCVCTPSLRKTTRSTGACSTRPGKRRASRCSITPRSTCSETRWCAHRAMPCGASIPPASTRCSWGISFAEVVLLFGIHDTAFEEHCVIPYEVERFQ